MRTNRKSRQQGGAPWRDVPRAVAGVVGAAALALAPAGAATRHWLGLGSSASWSDAANWSAALLPSDGDDLVFGGSPPWLRSIADLNLTLRTLRFEPGSAQFELRVSQALVFSGGAGIQNLTGSGGALVQEMVATSGGVGGSITFSGASGVNLGGNSEFRPVSFTAAGAMAADGPGAAGGRIVFEGTASTGSDSFVGLRAQGAGVAGGGAGSLLFTQAATTGTTALMVVTGGSAEASVGGMAHFADNSQLQGGLAVLAGSLGGQGGRAYFTGSSRAALNASVDNIGADRALAGAEAVTRFAEDSRLLAGALNREATASGGSGGRLEFGDRAMFDSSGRDPMLGSLMILNRGSDARGAGSGSLVFADDSGTRGTLLVISNRVEREGLVPGSAGGTTAFRDRSQAGSVQVFNEGAMVGSFLGLDTTHGGRTSFHQQASAGQARFTSSGGNVAAALGGRLDFFDDSSAASATIVNEGAQFGAAHGGLAVFSDRSTAAAARVDNLGGASVAAAGGQLVFNLDANAGSAVVSNIAAVDGATGGRTDFADRARAGNAAIQNEAPLGAEGGSAVSGSTRFRGQASADSATVLNVGASHSATPIAGNTRFEDDSSAGSATIYNGAGRSAGAAGGFTVFSQRASAGSAVLFLGSGAASSGGGVVEFFNTASAAQAQFDAQGPTLPDANGGALRFFDSADAGDAVIVLGGSHQAGFLGATATFTANASAGRATVLVGGGKVAGALGARVDFGSGPGFVASGGQSSISNQAATVANARGGVTLFGSDSSAGSAHIVNEGAVAGQALGGLTEFSGNGNAGSATIVNAAGIGFFAGGGTTLFRGSSNAGSAHITYSGSGNPQRASGAGEFSGNSSAGSATLRIEANLGAGGQGGLLRFNDNANGGQARAIVEGGDGLTPGRLLIQDVRATSISFGSIEGGGEVFIGLSQLVTGLNHSSTTFSGHIIDQGVGGRLVVVGNGRLTLTGANSYSGGTTVADGSPGGSGKLVVANITGSATGSGPVLVNRGGTLGGSGFIAGPVTLRPGGRIVPGDPVTLTLRDSLTWDGGGVIRLELGADTAGSDRLMVSDLIRGDNPAAGFRFELVNLAAVVGQSYEIVSFERQSGFDASDFSFDADGVVGNFSFDASGLLFTATALPVSEPATATMLLTGLLWVAHRRRRGSRSSGAAAAAQDNPAGRAAAHPARTSTLRGNRTA